MKNDKSLNELIRKAIVENWDTMALSDLGGVNFQYKDVAEIIAKMHILLRLRGLSRATR